MERKIGEVFECNGVKLRVEPEVYSCNGCYFKRDSFKWCIQYQSVRGECRQADRPDIGIIFKKVEDMEERIVKLTLEKAKEFYKKGGELKDLALLAYTESELTPLLKTWEEYCKICDIESLYDKQQIKIFIPANKQFSDAHIALMQLHQLRDCYRQGWEPNWKDGESVKYAIIRRENLITVISIWKSSSFLSFQRKETAEQFLENFKDLIEQAGDLI